MIGIDTSGQVVLPEVTLQWWPESISDSMSSVYSEKVIQGGSSALMGWNANNGRILAFDVKLSRNLRYQEDFKNASPYGDKNGVPLQAKGIDPNSKKNLEHNVDIRRMIRYLRAYHMPQYDANTGVAEPPPTCLLHVPGLNLNEIQGTDTVRCRMMTSDVTYMKTFPDGKPRLAVVSLTFKIIDQTPDGVFWNQRTDLFTPDDSILSHREPNNLKDRVSDRSI